jgi:hypothetical protein
VDRLVGVLRQRQCAGSRRQQGDGREQVPAVT